MAERTLRMGCCQDDVKVERGEGVDTPEESVPACVAFLGHLHGRALRRELWDLHCGAALDFFRVEG